MGLPNFRLYPTQARAGLIIGVAGVLCLGALAYCVFKGFQRENMVIAYNPAGGLGKYRKGAVFLMTASCGFAGLAATILGYNSLGQKRNNRQSSSWAGLLLGAIVLAVAPVLCYAWMVLSEQAILPS